MNTLWDSIKRELRRIGSKPVYLVMLLLVPIGCTLFFVSLMNEGLPLRTPVAVVDLDQSQLSRQIVRNLNSGDMCDIQYKLESYSDAMEKVRQGDIFGFFLITDRFEEDAMAGKSPTLVYYSNMTYYVPGTLSFKGFKTVAVTTTGGVVMAVLTDLGLSQTQASSLVQPVSIDSHPMGNPWINYCYYLTPSFTFLTFALLIMLFTSFTITGEIKHGTSRDWLKTAGNNIYVALAGKILPQSAILIAMTMGVAGLLWGFLHFPANGSIGWFLVALVLFILASQALSIFITCILPNPRLAMSIIGLLGVLSFSFTGISFPVQSMYGAIGIFSYIMPARYMFLIYVNNLLNGWDVYYVRYYYAVLTGFILLSVIAATRLKKACLNPVYLP